MPVHESTARLLRVQSQQLPTESQILEDEVLAGAERADHIKQAPS